MSVQCFRICDLHQLTSFLHGAVPGQLPLRLGPSLFRRIPTLKIIARLDVTGDLGGDTDANPPTPHIRQRHGTLSAIRFIGLALFPVTNFSNRPCQIPVPLHGVHGEIQMCIQNPHDLNP